MQYLSHRDHRDTSRVSWIKQTITPKKINFEEVEQKNQQFKQKEPVLNNHPSFGKSFLSMISPIKNRNNSMIEDREKENNKKSIRK